MALLTVAEAKVYFQQITGSSTALDDRLTDIISAADPLLARLLGFPENDSNTYTLESATYTEYFDGPACTNSRAVMLSAQPVTAITSVHDSPDWGYDAGDLIDSGDYTFTRDGWVYLTPSGTGSFGEGLRRIKVIYTAGATLDDGEKEAVGALVVHLYHLPHRQGKQSSSQKGSTGSFTAEDVPRHILRKLSHLADPAVMLG